MNRYSFTGLVKIEFPTGTVRLCDGGVFTWGAESYVSKDAIFGTIASAEQLDEGIGAEVPAYQITLLPHPDAGPGDLSQPGFQTSRARFWLAMYDPEDGTIVGTPDLQFDGQVDLTRLIIGKAKRELEMTVVSSAERLFQRNLGNSLNPAFHKSVYPGETGEDQATGLGRQLAWGVEAPATSAGAGYGGGTNGANGPSWRGNVNYL